MSILNHQLEFEQLPAGIKNAFTGARGSKVLIPAGTSLFRFSGHTHISAWWSETANLHALLLGAKSSGLPLAQHIRKTNAVLRLWDPGMFNLIIGTLNQPVYGFRGGISAQNEASAYMNPEFKNTYKKKFTKSVFLQGGNGQVYISGLGIQHVQLVVPAGAMNIFDPVDDIIDTLVQYNII